MRVARGQQSEGQIARDEDRNCAIGGRAVPKLATRILAPAIGRAGLGERAGVVRPAAGKGGEC